MATFWLSMHVPYACRHAGACCSSGWAIPVEREQIDRLAVLRPDRTWLRPAPDAPPDIGGTLAIAADGHCVFHGARCEIHGRLGHAALPSSCRHFPRQCLIDPRGVSVTLSHYCPTAAALLARHEGPLAIVEGPPAVPEGEPEGLDARDALPPLLTPRVLMDHESYAAWEAHAIDRLAGPESLALGATPEDLLDSLDRDAASLSSWKGADGDLPGRIRSLGGGWTRPGAAPSPTAAREEPDGSRWANEARLVGMVRASMPEDRPSPPAPLRPERWTPSLAEAWRAHRVLLNRFLAAHAFASWMAYQGNGLRANVRHLRLALAVLRLETVGAAAAGPLTTPLFVDAIRQTDLLLLHLVDRAALARRLSGSAA